MKKPFKIHAINRVWHQISFKRKVQVYALILLMIFASLAELFSIGAVVPLLTILSTPEKMLVDENWRTFISLLHISDSDNLLAPAVLVFCFFTIISGALRYFLLVAQTKITYSIGVDLSVGIYEKVLNQPYLVHISRNSSEVIAGVSTKANELIVSLLYPVIVIISSLIMLIIVFTALVFIEPKITLITITTFAIIYLLILTFIRLKISNLSLIISDEYKNVIKLVQEGLGGIRDILLDGNQKVFIRNYRIAEKSLRDSRAMIQIMSGTPRYIIETLSMLFLVCLAVFLSNTINDLSLIIPALGVFVLAAQRLIPVMQQLYSSWISIEGGYSSVLDALDLLEQRMTEIVHYGKSRFALPFLEKIELRDISFGYDPFLPEVLSNVNLTIPKGARLGIIGETGSGKSTILDILMGLILPTTGTISIDGCALDPQSVSRWQRQIAHVPQSIYLADSSILENIAFGLQSEEIDHSRVVAAAKIAQIDGFIQQLPNGYATNVGERGARLSGGQCQRLGIARALYKEASVIVLDEATSALDDETERLVMDAIHSLTKKITLVIVAHRKSTLQQCTEVIEIKNGTIKSVGN